MNDYKYPDCTLITYQSYTRLNTSSLNDTLKDRRQLKLKLACPVVALHKLHAVAMKGSGNCFLGVSNDPGIIPIYPLSKLIVSDVSELNTVCIVDISQFRVL